MQLTIIANITENYYHVSNEEVNLTSIISFVAVVLLTIPSNFLLAKVGIRNYIILAAAFNFGGTVVKYIGVDPKSFYLMLLGQALVAISGVNIESLSPLLARIWFPVGQVSRATSFGLLSTFVGILLAMTVPVLIVPNSNIVEDVKRGFTLLFIVQTLISEKNQKETTTMMIVQN
ncbi:feline leukemia virus subgroup C receptor-related protein 1-like isoform X4 [Leptotrombidium deliense]|uniref:Feline leukemia virus subgroup C receptor-related protein 1-like isoform X4 n=1 Tax=Leptotrombidium deliense TaxID=299467 RepID=A0A443SBN8_9ACAR|nr:feline leukemia virus subgroup C receptor-related protein 1-like isoform X4 [Leptotrombidium deliense]